MSRSAANRSPPDDAENAQEIRDIRIPPIGLAGTLHVPKEAYALVAFAHGSGSSRLSPRNMAVASKPQSLHLDCSAPARELRLLLWRRRNFLIASVQWSRAAGAPTSLVRHSTQFARRLLIVGGVDFGVIELNEQAFARLQGPKALEIVPGASHLFPEPGALEAVIGHAARWFEHHLTSHPPKRTLAAGTGD